MWAGWGLLVALSLLGWPAVGRIADLWPMTADAWFGAIWPMLLGTAFAVLVVTWRRRAAGARDLAVPPGDLLVPLLALARARRPVPKPTADAGHGPEYVTLTIVPAWPALVRAEAALSARGGLALAGIAAALALLLIAMVG